MKQKLFDMPFLPELVMKSKFFLFFAIVCNTYLMAQIAPQPGRPQYLLNEPIDISGDFHDFTNTYYLADSLVSFDPASGTGTIKYRRYEYATRQAFNNMLGGLNKVPQNEFPSIEYADAPVLPFAVEFVSPRTVRVRARSGFQARSETESLMLVGGKAPVDNSWKYSKIEGGTQVFEYLWVRRH